MVFDRVIAQFVKGIDTQLKRRNREGRDNFTPNETKALEYYGKAAQQLTALNVGYDEEGFEIRDYVPIHLQFKETTHVPSAS